jgi:lipopolysaccharide transport system ATP-binding protein
MTYACRVEQLGKRYRVDRDRPSDNYGYRTLREDLIRLAAAPWRGLRGWSSAGKGEDFWALREVDFEIQPGEVVGIIGRNGAGKSTLLKILSRVTRPTAGEVLLRGRVGSLLEVGTGFHPELTGRENVYLNGAVLGMGRREIARKFDEIVAFAEVERFLDTPIKRYSSGMYVRLGFAVAAHLEPEVLIVDEVLAVGDMAFQRKCLGRMREVGQSGRTVLFVSHSMPAIESLCARSILFEAGRIAYDGPSQAAIRQYINLATCLTGAPIGDRTDRTGEGGARAVHLEILGGDGVSSSTLRMGDGVRINLSFTADRSLSAICIGLLFDTENGQRLFSIRSSEVRGRFRGERGRTVACCEVPALPLSPGRYYIHTVIKDHEQVLDRVSHAAAIDILPSDIYGTGRIPGVSDGPCFVHSRWSSGQPAGGDGNADSRNGLEGKIRALDGIRAG